MLCGYEGDRKSGLTLAIYHKQEMSAHTWLPLVPYYSSSVHPLVTYVISSIVNILILELHYSCPYLMKFTLIWAV